MDGASNWQDMTIKGKLVAVDMTVGVDTEAARGAKSLQLYKNELFRWEGRRSQL